MMHTHVWDETRGAMGFRGRFIGRCQCGASLDVTAERRSQAARKAAETRKRRDGEYVAEHGDLSGILGVGDLLTGSWGYDQTNAELWQVVARSGRTVTIRPVDGFVSNSGPSERVYPCKDQFAGDPVRKVVTRFGSVKLFKWGVYLHKWDGGAMRQTAPNWGH